MAQWFKYLTPKHQRIQKYTTEKWTKLVLPDVQGLRIQELVETKHEKLWVDFLVFTNANM